MRNLFGTASQNINRVVEALVSVMGMLMAVIVVIQVFSRYGLNHSLFWSEELARILLVCLTFLGATVAYYHGAHPGVDGFFNRLPPFLRRWAHVGGILAGLALFSVMVVFGFKFAFFVRLQITPALGLPKWIPMGIVPLSGVIFFVHGLAFLTRAVMAPGASSGERK